MIRTSAAKKSDIFLKKKKKKLDIHLSFQRPSTTIPTI